jgi:hypothetical protein
MDLGITEGAQRERKMSPLSLFPLVKVLNILILLNIFEGVQGAQHSHWGARCEHLLWDVTSATLNLLGMLE